MNADDLRAVQAPLKDQYKAAPDSAVITLSSKGELDADDVVCRVETGKALVAAGLHPATGGTGAFACSGNMLLDALVACAGVTLKAVATAIGFDLKGGSVSAEGDLDFRGTLGVAKDAPVGFREIRLAFHLDTTEPQDRIDQLTKLTERYCVVFQTLAKPPVLTLAVKAHG
ncbi:MAG: OsmC family protein [Rhodospirillaceae bacterium]|nr:OsmC family protein [Rhodospirillales bacterium]